MENTTQPTDPYIQKNKGFITSSKIKAFLTCQKCYEYKYELEIPDPTASGEFYDKDHFLIGTAVDDLITHGKDEFDAKYEVVARRNKNAEKIQLTNTHFRTISALEREFRAQELYNHKPKKHVIEYDFEGLMLRAELDDFDKENARIIDIKTCANVATFNPEFYLIQMSFYQWLIEETEGVKCDAMLEIVDKYKYFSRSMPFIYTKETLESHRGTILTALADMKLAQESGLYASATDQEVLNCCPYYGYKNHARPTEAIIY